MSIDFAFALNVALTSLVSVILVAGIYRATELRSAFVDRVYRSRSS